MFGCNDTIKTGWAYAATSIIKRLNVKSSFKETDKINKKANMAPILYAIQLVPDMTKLYLI